jgi:2-amino-4-hydroxy-6-hydroxymethyldihydropteridine diphosphokinase
VAEVQTDLEPEPLLAELKGGEQVIGRGKPIIRWGPREIDLDILLFEDRVLHTANLIIPHPALRERDFVIRHLIELNANLRDPETGRFLSEYL